MIIHYESYGKITEIIIEKTIEFNKANKKNRAFQKRVKNINGNVIKIVFPTKGRL